MVRKVYQDTATPADKRQFSRYLAEDEELVLVTGYGRIYMRQMFVIYLGLPGLVFILGGVGISYLLSLNLILGFGAGFLVAIFVAFVKCHFLYNAHRYLLTTRRVVIKSGYFSVKLTSALYDKITHIEVDQSLFDRMIMRHGSVIINTAGMNKAEIKLDYVDSPVEFKNLLERLINREREQYGRSTGPVIAIEGEVVE